jgi:hypothetical protein
MHADKAGGGNEDSRHAGEHRRRQNPHLARAALRRL